LLKERLSSNELREDRLCGKRRLIRAEMIFEVEMFVG